MIEYIVLYSKCLKLKNNVPKDVSNNRCLKKSENVPNESGLKCLNAYFTSCTDLPTLPPRP